MSSHFVGTVSATLWLCRLLYCRRRRWCRAQGCSCSCGTRAHRRRKVSLTRYLSVTQVMAWEFNRLWDSMSTNNTIPSRPGLRIRIVALLLYSSRRDGFDDRSNKLPIYLLRLTAVDSQHDLTVFLSSVSDGYHRHLASPGSFPRLLRSSVACALAMISGLDKLELVQDDPQSEWIRLACAFVLGPEQMLLSTVNDHG
ncbi:hypothetical protein IW261DRAFT_383889 [Armillaria novae-zelandiae]|uniref:Transcription factor domain-containing protein n=1 Tax=Armillaria novae-zelandiae TaxID=153914 RepID=A0AA39PSS3_9AGAR|nr:hypothetical protein IW261DRAFT_383889 [Armillaria novae-zelandiae]